MSTRFYFAVCQPGADKTAKSEITREFPHLKFAFSRPGFITFKDENTNTPEIKKTKSIFTRLWGTVAGQTKDFEGLLELLELLPEQSLVHAFDRENFIPGDEPVGHKKNSNILRVWSEIPALLKNKFRFNAAPQSGEPVFDLIFVDDFHVFVGRHFHHEGLFPHSGNQPHLTVPEESPSRAYLKIVEAIELFKPDMKKGMKVLEVGCSPGGASIAMLRKGLSVTGVDPKKMAPQLSNEPQFSFIQKMAKAVTPEDLKLINPDWVVMDMNIAPLEAIDELTHVLICLRKNWGKDLKLKGGLLTIKLNDWKFAESIPLYLRRLEECGFRNITTTQLYSNRQEFFVMANGFKTS